MKKLVTGRPSRKQKIVASVQGGQDDITRMNVNISKKLHKRIKQRALDDEMTVTELVKKAVSDYLGKQTSK